MSQVPLIAPLGCSLMEVHRLRKKSSLPSPAQLFCFALASLPQDGPHLLGRTHLTSFKPILNSVLNQSTFFFRIQATLEISWFLLTGAWAQRLKIGSQIDGEIAALRHDGRQLARERWKDGRQLARERTFGRCAPHCYNCCCCLHLTYNLSTQCDCAHTQTHTSTQTHTLKQRQAHNTHERMFVRLQVPLILLLLLLALHYISSSSLTITWQRITLQETQTHVIKNPWNGHCLSQLHISFSNWLAEPPSL